MAEVLREPMLALLLGGGLVYLLLGDLKEAVILLVFALLSVLITVVQEARTERVLEALRDLTSPRALVIRDATRRRIAGRDVVLGDLVVLAEADRVPADATLRRADRLEPAAGATAFALAAAIFVVASWHGMPESEVRALTFVSLVFTIVGLIFVNRSFSASMVTAFRRPNPALAWVLPVAAMLGLTLLWPLASDLFRFRPLQIGDLSVTVAAGLVVLGALEALKPLWRTRLQS